jgi:hypothetical protein
VKALCVTDNRACVEYFKNCYKIKGRRRKGNIKRRKEEKKKGSGKEVKELVGNANCSVAPCYA